VALETLVRRVPIRKFLSSREPLETLVRRLLIREFFLARQLLVALEISVRRLLIQQFLVASSREFEAASGHEFDVPTASCNNHASPSIEYTVQTEFDQERQQQRLDDVEKFLQDQGAIELPRLSHMFGSNQYPQVQLSPETTENSSMAMVSEFGWSQLADISKVPDTGRHLAQLVEAEEPSVALVSDLGWPDVHNNNKEQPGVSDTGEQLEKLVAAEDPAGALVSDLGWLGTAAENIINSTGDPSLTTHQVYCDQTGTFTLPVVSATSLEQSRGQLLDDALLAMASEASNSLEANNSSLGTSISSLGNNNSSPGTNISLTATNNTRSCQGLQVSNYPGEHITDAAVTRPSVIVPTGSSSRKRAFKETNGCAEKKLISEKNAPALILVPDPIMDDDQSVPILMFDPSMDDDQDEVSPAVLEKRRKANARCRKYRVNKKQRETIEKTELEMLTERNEFLREKEKRLTDRKRKLQQCYLSLIRQKKIRFQ